MADVRTVWKFSLLSTGPMEVNVPGPGNIVLVGRDPATGMVAFWAEVIAQNKAQSRWFQIVGTGHDIPEDAQHRGSVIIGDSVWHLFELEVAHGR